MITEQTKKKLTSLSEMFGDPIETEIKITDKSEKISVDQLVPFRDHPFKPYTGKRFEDMVRSVRDLGVLEPVLIRPIPNDIKREILAGHNRWKAAKEAGLKEIPYVMMEGLSDEEAMLIVTETNLIQRSFMDLAHSERAFVLAQHHAAIKAQGKRVDIINEVKMLLKAGEIREETTFGPVGQKLNTRVEIAKEYDLSGRSVARYLRINLLQDELKEHIDDEKISIRAGVELSYLSKTNQRVLIDILSSIQVNLDEKIASELRRLDQVGRLDEQRMIQIVTGESKKPKKEVSILKGFKVKSNVMKKYFNEHQTVSEVEEIIDKALELYYENKLEHSQEVQ